MKKASESSEALRSGAEGDRTPNLSIANAALSQLSYGPLVSQGGIIETRARHHQGESRKSHCHSRSFSSRPYFVLVLLGLGFVPQLIEQFRKLFHRPSVLAAILVIDDVHEQVWP